MTKNIDYGTLMHKAMRTLIFDVLKDVEENGLPGEHHFFITFDTNVEGVEISEWLRKRYPEEMTIVIQHWFDGLNVTNDGFNITLNFGDQPEPLVIPFLAILTFVDPSVEFGLRFEQNEDDDIPQISDMEQANLPEKEKKWIKDHNWIHKTVHTRFAVTGDPGDLAKQTVSFSFVRHPYER
mgnify:CR=1 FL=1